MTRNFAKLLLLSIAEGLLLESVLLDAVGNLELLVAELVLGQVLVPGDHRVEFEGAFVRSLEVAQEILNIDAVSLLVGTILSLLGLAP